MIINIAFFVIILGYTLYSLFFVNTVNSIVRLLVSIISLAIAIAINPNTAEFVAKSIDMLKIDSTNEYILGMEVVYYKTTAFIFSYIFIYAIFIVITNMLNLPNYVDIKNRKWMSGLFGFVNVVIGVIIAMNVILSSPIGIIYSNDFSYTLASLLSIDSLMSGCTFDYAVLKETINSNSHLVIPDLNLSVLEVLEVNDYATKSEMQELIYNSNLLSEKIVKWLAG